MSHKEVYQYIMSGNVLEKPVDCPEEVYELLCHCWNLEPNDRPSFSEVLTNV